MKGKLINKILSAGAAVLLAALALLFYMNYDVKVEDGIMIGVPADSGGLLFDYLNKREDNNLKVRVNFSTYPLRDCCSSVGEWALGSDRLHLAVICPDAAARLLNGDERFALIGPVLVNSDVVVLRPGVVPKRVGITHNRWYQQKIAEYYFGPECEILTMLPAALPYAFYKNEVDGVVVDITKGFYLEGDFLPGKVGSEDLVTYVLVGRKDVMETPQVLKFMEYYAEAVKELQDPSLLQSALTDFDVNLNTGKEGRVWESMGTRLICPQPGGKK